MATEKGINPNGADDGSGEPPSRSRVTNSDSGNYSGNVGGNNEAGTGGDATDDGRIAGLGAVDPNAIGTGEPAGQYGFRKDGSPAAKRGRKPGGGGNGTRASGSAKSAAKDNQSVKGLEKLLVSLHMMAAAATKTPELAIDNSEAAMMASAISAVQSHYDFDVSAEVTIWVNLITATAAVYGPRAVTIYNRKKKEREKKRPLASVSSISENNGAPTFDIPGMHSPAN